MFYVMSLSTVQAHIVFSYSYLGCWWIFACACEGMHVGFLRVLRVACRQVAVPSAGDCDLMGGLRAHL